LCRPAVHRHPNVDPSEGRGCCCAPSRSQQRRSWSSPLRRRRRPDQAVAASTWQPPLLQHLAGYHRRSLWTLSPLGIPYSPRQFLQDSCPRRLPRLRHMRSLRCLRLRHARPRLHHLPSQTSRHTVHGRSHRLLASGGWWEPKPRGHVTPRSRPAPGGGCWSLGDTWRPQSCPKPGGGSRSHGDTWCPRSCPSREVEVRAAGTRCAPGAALCQEAGAGIQVTRGAPGAVHPLLFRDFDDDHNHLDLGIKGLSSACGTHQFVLQSQHTRHHGAATAGGCQFVRFYLQLILQSHRLWCSRCDYGGMLENIC
jgi:hypothetical protein